MSWSRRRALAAGGGLAAVCAVSLIPGGPARAAPAAALLAARTAERPGSKRIALARFDAADSLDIEFYRGGAYLAEALLKVQTLLRDDLTGDEHPIDPSLLDYLYDLAQAIGVDPVFSVLSGYRSPRINRMLEGRSSGAATRSLHMEGRAIDVRLAEVDCADLADRALGLERGGVGYYRHSDFVHLDTGRFRSWRG